MSQQTLWLTLEPKIPYTQILLTQPGVGTLLKARLATEPAQAGAMPMFLEALSSWHGMPLCAVVDADAEGVERRPDRWAWLMNQVSQNPRITVEWSSPAPGRLWKDPFFDVGDFRSARRLVHLVSTGQR